MNQEKGPVESSDVDSEINSDRATTVEQLKQLVGEFVSRRDWQQFHSPKNLSMALSIEAAELMEHFQWISMEESRCPDQGKQLAIEEELADVLCYAMGLANELKIDISQAMKKKMVKNRRKYPIEEYKGIYGKEQKATHKMKDEKHGTGISVNE